MRARARRAANASCCRRETTVDTLAEHAEGLVALSGCARQGLGVLDADGAARLAQAFRGAFYVELQRPYERGDARRNAQRRRARRAVARADRRHR